MLYADACTFHYRLLLIPFAFVAGTTKYVQDDGLWLLFFLLCRDLAPNCCLQAGLLSSIKRQWPIHYGDM